MEAVDSGTYEKAKPTPYLLPLRPFSLYAAGLYDFSKLKELDWTAWRFFLRGRVKTRQLGTPQNPPLRAGGMFGIGLKGRIKRKRMSERKMAERAPG